MVTHLGHNWYQFDLETDVTNWILDCIDEHMQFVQPYDTIKLRAKRNYNNSITYKVVFSATYNEKYSMPVCYLMDLSHGKFKGNNMHYYIDSEGTKYCDVFPVYHDHLKFTTNSKYSREKSWLFRQLSAMEVPEEHELTSKEKRTIIKAAKTQRQRQRKERTSRKKSCNRPKFRIDTECYY